jgi:hypothetical protein
VLFGRISISLGGGLLSRYLIDRLFVLEQFGEEVAAYEAELARLVEFCFGRVELAVDKVSTVFPAFAVGQGG